MPVDKVIAKFEVQRTVQVLETIEVELPFYFKNDLSDYHSESVVFGRIEEKRVVKLHKNCSYAASSDVSWELSVEAVSSLKFFGGYLTEGEYQSGEAEFRGALREFRGFQDEELVKKSSFVFGG